MKILIDGIIYSLKKTGGIRRYFNGYLPLLNKTDKNVEVELFLHGGFKGRLNFNNNIKISYIREIPIPLPKTIFEPLIEPINEAICQRHWSKIKGDLFHSTYYTCYPNKDLPQVVTVYDMIHERFPEYFPGKKNDNFREKKKAIIESATAIICISENTRKDLLKFCPEAKDKISVIYPGRDGTFKKISDKSPKNQFLKRNKIKKPFLLYVGPRGRYKNFLLFVEAYAVWKGHCDFEIIAVGGNQFSRKEKSYFKKLGILNKIHNFGYITDEDLSLFYNCAYAFVYPSLYEGFGMPLLEAMACGTLVLAANKASFPEVGKDCILFFNPDNSSDMVRVLDEALLKNQRLKLINKGLKRAKDFSWEKTARQTLAVYNEII